MTRGALVTTICLTAVLLLAGCSGYQTAGVATGQPTPTDSPSPVPANVVVVPKDAEAFAQLKRVASTALKLEGGSVTSTRCWTPSEHLFNDLSVAPAGTWKVICRVHYNLRGVARYQDATCIGDFDLTPMLDHCYVWELYSGEPHYEDGNRLATPAPTPLP